MTTWRGMDSGRTDVEPRAVAESLDRVTRPFGAPPARFLASVFSRWEGLVGPEIARHAQPHSLRDGVLLLVVDQPAWATQLRYLTAELVARVGADVSSPDITEIQIRVAAPAGATRATPPAGRRPAREGAPSGDIRSSRRSWNPSK
jgi:hypothetical protein